MMPTYCHTDSMDVNENDYTYVFANVSLEIKQQTIGFMFHLYKM
jgi:hypothetical protein